MKRWERFNENSGLNQSLEEQAIRIYTHDVLDRVEHSAVRGDLVEAAQGLPMMEIYQRVKDWLQEEEEA